MFSAHSNDTNQNQVSRSYLGRLEEALGEEPAPQLSGLLFPEGAVVRNPREENVLLKIGNENRKMEMTQ